MQLVLQYITKMKVEHCCMEKPVILSRNNGWKCEIKYKIREYTELEHSEMITRLFRYTHEVLRKKVRHSRRVILMQQCVRESQIAENRFSCFK